MLVYEFKCSECGSIQQHDYNYPHVFCHECKDDIREMKRVYSIGGIAFKGSGFYKTDNT